MKTPFLLHAALLSAALLIGALVPSARAQTPERVPTPAPERVPPPEPQRVPAPEPQRVPAPAVLAAALPDLAIREVQAVPSDDRKLRVRVVNVGQAGAGPCNLKLFYHRSGQVMVRGTAVPALAQGGEDWLIVDVGSPIAHASAVTLRVDDPDRVGEADEANNGYVYK